MTTEMQPRTEPKWLWYLVCTLGWVFLGQFSLWIFLLSVFVGPAAVYITVGLTSAVAWFVTGFACRRGAPRGIWLTSVLGTGQLFVLYGALTLEDFPDSALLVEPRFYWAQMGEFALSFGTILLILVGPLLAGWLSARRLGAIGAHLEAAESI